MQISHLNIRVEPHGDQTRITVVMATTEGLVKPLKSISVSNNAPFDLELDLTEANAEIMLPLPPSFYPHTQ